MTQLNARPATVQEGYPGSKAGAGVWQRIISLMPAHRVYVEPFLGHGAVMRRKKPGEINIGIDRDTAVIAWWARHRQVWPDGRTSIEAEDALQILSSHSAMADPRALVYLDPPYLRETRTRLFYNYEFESPEQHSKLLRLIKTLPCMVMISGYWSRLYADELADWRVDSFRAMTRGGVRVEHIWMNFGDDLPLHDPRWVGNNFRERERIKRMRETWTRRFAAMTPSVRQLIGEALAEVDRPSQPAARVDGADAEAAGSETTPSAG